MKKQVVVISGGDTFATYKEYLNFLRNYKIDIDRYKSDKTDWKPWLRQVLGESYEVILPKMPNVTNARFEEWKLCFEKFIPFLNSGVVLVGHSLGGSFLAKYLSKNQFPKKIEAVFLVAACFGDNLPEYKAVDFHISNDINKLSIQARNIFLYHSKDDPVVPFADLIKFKEKLPIAQIRIFDDGGHFIQEEFPELVEDILNLDN